MPANVRLVESSVISSIGLAINQFLDLLLMTFLHATFAEKLDSLHRNFQDTTLKL